MRIHGDWSAAGFDLPPAAPLTGPFAGRAFLETWWRHRGTGEALLVESDGALLPLWRHGDTVGFLGEADLTDYHAPRGGEVRELTAAFAAGLQAGDRVVFDSLPDEAAGSIETGLRDAGLAPQRSQHEIAAVLDLPERHDDYLGALSKKQRHEVRRKRRRFETALGDPQLVQDRGGFARFVAMHRAAPGEKGQFMTPEMEAFFSDLLDVPGSSLDLLVAGDEIAAAALGFHEAGAYYLYNSSFAPEAAPASPGVVLIDLLIERAIAAGRRRFDFLKGDETYKFRLGATRRPLWKLEAVVT